MTLFNLKSKLIIWWLDFLCPGPSRNMLRYIKSVSPQREPRRYCRATAVMEVTSLHFFFPPCHCSNIERFLMFMNHFEFEIFENCWSSYIKVINADSASILQEIWMLNIQNLWFWNCWNVLPYLRVNPTLMVGTWNDYKNTISYIIWWDIIFNL